MRVRVEVVEGMEPGEIVIQCARQGQEVNALRALIEGKERSRAEFVFYKQNQEFFFPLESVLFFETQGERVYAHTARDAYLVKYRLYELEELLPAYFARAAKAVIANTRAIYSITRNIGGASLIQFIGTHKQIYASRYYYGALRQRLKENYDYEK